MPSQGGLIQNFRKVFSILLVIVGFTCVGLFATSLMARHLGEEARVSQVFKLLKAVPLGPGNYLAFYDVAVTPSAKDKTAVICHLFTFTPESYIDLLEKKVWLFSLEPLPYAYFESPHTDILTYVILGFGIVLLVLSFLLYPPKEE